MATTSFRACANCEASEKKIEQLIDDRDVFEAQRDHHRERCEELMSEVKELRQQLNNKFKISDYNTDPSLFHLESMERLQEWQKCLAYCIEEMQEKKGSNKSQVGEFSATEGEESKEGKGEEGGGEMKPGELESNCSRQRWDTELPFSPGNLAGFLTRNHRLTQAHTPYPEPLPRSKKS